MDTQDEKRDPIFRRKHKGEPGNGGKATTLVHDEADLNDLISPERAEHFRKVAFTTARRYASRLNGIPLADAEDVAQTSLMQFLDAVKKRPALLDENPEGYLSKTVSHEFIDVTSPVERSVRSGRAELARRAAIEEQNLGRHLTASERDALAEDVRANWAGKSVPPQNFQKLDKFNKGALPVDFTERRDENIVTLMQSEAVGRPEVELFRYEPGQWADIVVHENARNSKSADLFRYNAFAEAVKCPMVEPSHMPRRREVDIINRLVLGAAAAEGLPPKRPQVPQEAREREFVRRLEAFADGDDTHEQDLFAPWDRPTGQFNQNGNQISVMMPIDDRLEVAEALLRHREHAYALWISAIKLANKENADRVKTAFDSMLNATPSTPD